MALHTVNPIESELIYQFLRCPYKSLQTGLTPRYSGKILASLASSSDRQDDLHLRVLWFELCECPEATIGAVNGHLRVGPFIAQLNKQLVSSGRQ